jgi:uncharacterized membrane protein (UPF0182 family)
VSGAFDDTPAAPAPRKSVASRRPRALIPTLAIVVALVIAYSVFVDVWTERLWFGSVGYTSVFTKVLLTRIGLFVVFGVFISGAVVANAYIAYRLRPLVVSGGYRNPTVERYQENIEPIRKWLLIGLAGVLLLAGGVTATGHWQEFLLWVDRVSFGQKDVYFHRDISFFVFSYPWYRFVINFVSTTLILAIIAAGAMHYLYGGIRIQASRDKVSRATQVHLSVLFGLFMLVRAVSYWLDRYGLAMQQSRRFTGISYTDVHAVLPAKNILAVISLICAALFIANVIRPTLMLPVLGLGLLILSAILIGGIWPAIVQRFQVRPSEPDKEGPYIHRNIVATRSGYGLVGTRIESYPGTSNATPTQLQTAADRIPSVRLQDPHLIAPAFEQLQQVRGFYSMPSVLDVDRYKVGAQTKDVVIGARELNLDGLGSTQRNWANIHTVYTHGYGVVAAYGADKGANSEPHWAMQDLPSRGDFGPFEQRIYYGEQEPQYSIVGRPKASSAVELNIPDDPSNQGNPNYRTYTGRGGVQVGSTFRQLLYATKFMDSSILLSGRVNSESKLIYDRSPRTMVRKVAPWLTLDADTYPAVVDKRLVWIIDGYTTTNSYPMSERITLANATDDSRTGQGQVAKQSSTQINYMRNSVKAVVDAYDGTVTLYQWDTKDPLLKAWMKVFPNTVKPKSTISADLMAHLRYPQDLFKVQREILSRYHVENSLTFYNNSDAWRVPMDPTEGSSIGTAAVAQPPYYLTVKLPGEPSAFSLTSTYVPISRQNLAGFVGVNSDPESSHYGQITVLQLPTDNTIAGPTLAENTFNANTKVSSALLPYKSNNSNAQARLGNLLTLPLDNQMLYVQPVYTEQGGEVTYPILQFVIVSINKRVGIGSNFSDAINSALQVKAAAPTQNQGNNGGKGTKPSNQSVQQRINSYVDSAQSELEAAQKALHAGDLGQYQAHNKAAMDWLQKAIDLRNQNPTPSKPSKPAKPASNTKPGKGATGGP